MKIKEIIYWLIATAIIFFGAHVHAKRAVIHFGDKIESVCLNEHGFILRGKHYVCFEKTMVCR